MTYIYSPAQSEVFKKYFPLSLKRENIPGPVYMVHTLREATPGMFYPMEAKRFIPDVYGDLLYITYVESGVHPSRNRRINLIDYNYERSNGYNCHLLFPSQFLADKYIEEYNRAEQGNHNSDILSNKDISDKALEQGNKAMTRDDVRRVVLETMIELGLQPRVSQDVGQQAWEAHFLLSGEPRGNKFPKDTLKAKYPHLVPGKSEDEIILEAISAGKIRPLCIWNKKDLLAFYEATDEEREYWNKFVEERALSESKKLDMGEALSAYTSMDRDGNVTGWSPSMWFIEWQQEYRKRNPRTKG